MTEAELQQRVRQLELENSELKKILSLVKDNIDDVNYIIKGYG